VQAEAFGDSGQRWREIADQIHAEVCERGFDQELNSLPSCSTPDTPSELLLL
jgi:GH15 family glucan-1,4-alpha-glucosidase